MPIIIIPQPLNVPPLGGIPQHCGTPSSGDAPGSLAAFQRARKYIQRCAQPPAGRHPAGIDPAIVSNLTLLTHGPLRKFIADVRAEPGSPRRAPGPGISALLLDIGLHAAYPPEPAEPTDADLEAIERLPSAVPRSYPGRNRPRTDEEKAAIGRAMVASHARRRAAAAQAQEKSR